MDSVPVGNGPVSWRSIKERRAMFHLRRSTAAVLLVGSAMVPALAVTQVYAVGPPSAAVSAVSAGWTFYATYPDHASCLAAGPVNPYGAAWECRPSSQPGAYDLFVLL
jgi:hypothetical protein